MAAPRWNPENLQKHYDKRIQKDDHCWQELLKLSRSMTRDEYEQASQKAYQTSCLEYEAVRDEYETKALHRVDKRTVLTISSTDRQRMITCFHRHYHWAHIPGSATPSLENLIEFIDDLDARIDGKEIKLFRIEPVKENLSGNQVKKYVAPRLRPLLNKCTKDE